MEQNRDRFEHDGVRMHDEVVLNNRIFKVAEGIEPEGALNQVFLESLAITAADPVSRQGLFEETVELLKELGVLNDQGEVNPALLPEDYPKGK